MYSVKKGLRCRICTGCGLCPGVVPKDSSEALHILTENAFPEGTFPLGGEKRLVTADIGTTTIAMLLYGEDGSVEDSFLAVNPQTKYGADVISRIREAQESEKAKEMQRSVTAVLEQGLERFGRRLEQHETMQMVLAANTTMTYLLMGWDTSELGCAPFRASQLQGLETEVAGVSCLVLPGMSAFVGGDIAAGMYACEMGERQELTLLIDLGTNGELVLGNRERRIACATAAGPAFEGGVNRGVWGADMVHLLAELREEGLLDETGLLAEPYFERGVRIGNVQVTQEAVRSVQLAKAAIAAGIEILFQKYGTCWEQVQRVVLAGGFGYYLKPEDAAKIGLLPKELTAKALAGGNTALAGAAKAGREMRKNGDFAGVLQELREMTETTESVNLAEEPDFEEKYIRHMNLVVI